MIVAAACASGADDDDDGAGSPTPTPTPSVCATDRSTRIHALEASGQLLSFDPTLVGTADPFAVVGTPDCAPAAALPPFPDPAAPYALAVDESDVAWILYTSGEIFRVSTEDATCAATIFQPEQTAGGTTWSLFGMAFVADSAGGGERLFVAGGPTDGSPGDLGVIDTDSLAVSRIAAVGTTAPMRPDLMGAADASLWGFFPAASSGFVSGIDGSTGALVGTSASLATQTISAWGAAHWGADFWIFLTTNDGVSDETSVHTLERGAGTHAVPLQNHPWVIVAAASSTCAPLE